MRIAVVTPFLDRRHGTERALLEQVRRLAYRYGCEVHLYARRVSHIPLNNQRGAKREAGAIIWHKVPTFVGPHLFQFSAWMVSNTLARWYSNWRGLRFDLVFSAGINCFDANAIIVHVLFHRLRQLLAEPSESRAERLGFLRWIHRRAYYRILSALERRIYSDRNVSLAAVSQRTADLLAANFQRKDVAVIPNGVDPAQFNPSVRVARRVDARARRSIRETDFVLLLIGNDWLVKGVSVILSAIAACIDLSFQLLVAGEDDRAPFVDLAHRLGLADRCRWEAPRADAIDLYAAADLYVSPSREDSFGLPVLEAMACGLPVITSAFAGISGHIRDGVDGFVVSNPQDAGALAKLLRSLHDDLSLRQRIGTAAAESAKAWTWDRNAEELWEFLKEAAARRG